MGFCLSNQLGGSLFFLHLTHIYTHYTAGWFIEFLKFLYPAGLADEFSTDNLTAVSFIHQFLIYLWKRKQ